VSNKTITAYKGFDSNLKCRDKQFEVGKDYAHSGPVKQCESGFHACESPLDVLSYYPLAAGNRYALVEASGEISREEGGDTKIASARLSIKAELRVPDLIAAAVKWTLAHAEGALTSKDRANAATTGYGANAATTGDGANAATTGYGANAATTGDGANAATTGDGANAATTGYGANAATTGDGANAATTGERAHAATTGNWAHAATTGYGANAATTGYGANAATTGERANAATTGYGANAATTGDGANAATTGYGANAATTGEKAVAAALGYDAYAKAGKGGAIVLIHRADDYSIKHIFSAKVGTKGIKPNTWYRLSATGKPVAVKASELADRGLA
jgi:hypothetical protein